VRAFFARLFIELARLAQLQILEFLADHRITEKTNHKAGMKAEEVNGVPEHVSLGPIPYHAYFAACGALFQIDGEPEYEQAIRKYLGRPNEQVRWWAEHALGIEGPTTAKRNAEYREKRARK
jgi:hypothetical protein